MFGRHLILYDGPCPFCQRAVRFILQHDHDLAFVFAPLEGKTATELFQKLGNTTLNNADSIILIENFRTVKQKELIEGKAVLRILWYLEKGYRFIGLLSFLPSFFFDFFYRYVAKKRYLFFGSKEKKEFPQGSESRFLP